MQKYVSTKLDYNKCQKSEEFSYLPKKYENI